MPLIFKGMRTINTTIELLTRQEVAKLLRVDPRTVDNLVSRKELTAYKIGRSVRFKKSDLLEVIENSLKGEQL